MARTTETQYARCGDLAIAYRVVGDGPVDLVLVPGFLSHVELDWEVPFFAAMLGRLARFSRLVLLDKRRHGLSDRSLGPGTLEDRMEDVRAVMDASGLSRAALMGVSEGGPLAILFAATHPERVSALVLQGTFARLCRTPDYEIGLDPAGIEQLAARIERHWGSGEILAGFVQRIPDPAAARSALARFERFATTPAVAADLIRRHIDADVRAALPAITAPTLVVHRARDPVVPAALGRYVAEHVRGARWIELPGDFHVSWLAEDHDAAIDPIETFLTGASPPFPSGASDRVFTTFLFTDVVGSTAHVARFGDARWRTILDQHDAAVREELERWRGREVRTTGDGFLAVFDGPARAVRCGLGIVERAHELGIDVRCGLHAGECEVRGDDFTGLAVHAAARVLAAAAPGEVLVTGTVKDIVVGSGLPFEARGMRAFKGVRGGLQGPM